MMVNKVLATTHRQHDRTLPPCTEALGSASLYPALPTAALPAKVPLGVEIPALLGGKKPNFIIVLTDDQGYDDIGLHQPQKPGGKPTWVNTPNLDNFIKHSTEFDNFYVAPMCSQSRAMLLTGRDFPRTGTMLINGGECQQQQVVQLPQLCLKCGRHDGCRQQEVHDRAVTGPGHNLRAGTAAKEGA